MKRLNENIFEKIFILHKNLKYHSIHVLGKNSHFFIAKLWDNSLKKSFPKQHKILAFLKLQ